MMKVKIQFKVLIIAIEVFALLAVVAGFFLMTPASQVSAGPVSIFDLAGNVKFYDPSSSGFIPAQAAQLVQAPQALVTGADSWVRLALFGDGSAVQIGSYSSMVYLESGDQNGMPYVRLRLDIGEVYVVPQNGAIYLETPVGTVYVDVPLTALHVTYDPKTQQAMVSCLDGVCLVTADGQEMKLTAGQTAGLGADEQVEMAAIVEPELVKAQAQELVKPVQVMAAFKQSEPTATLQLASEVVAKVEQPDPTAGPKIEPPQLTAVSPTQVPTQAPTQVRHTPVPTQTPTEIPTPEVEVEMRSVVLVADQEYYSNPGMGWQYRGGEYPTNKVVAETVAYAPRADISWKVLNPAEGVYDWSELDANLNYVVSQGKQFSFRVYTMRGEVYGGHQLPQWVIDKGARIFPDGQVDYANCTYQQEWGKFVNKLIQRYDGNPNISFIDISGYGNFNEWSWQDQTEWDQTWADAYAK
ncbi:MAG: hypothetical protein ABIK28_06895, partial [Planctomycetota bacterium]